MPTIYVKASRDHARRIIAAVPALLAGRVADPTNYVEGLLLVTGMTALAFIKDAFHTKATGGTDEAGDKWAPLKRETIANRRPAPRKKLGERPRGLLTADQDKRWRAIFARTVNWARKKGLDKPEAIAAGHAWNVLKSEGAKTKLEVYGGQYVEILRDTGVLLNSFSPGLPHNILRPEPGVCIVGTNVPYAIVHHKGSVKKGIPARPLWPQPEKWPAKWWGQITTKVRDGTVELIRKLFGV